MLAPLAALLFSAAPTYRVQLPPPAEVADLDPRNPSVTQRWICRRTPGEPAVEAGVLRPSHVSFPAIDVISGLYQKAAAEGVVHGGWSEGGGTDESAPTQAQYTTVQLASGKRPFQAYVVVQRAGWTVIGVVAGGSKAAARSCLGDFWAAMQQGTLELDPEASRAEPPQGEAIVPFDVDAPAGWRDVSNKGSATFIRNGSTRERYSRITVQTFALEGRSLKDAAMAQVPSGPSNTLSGFQPVDAGVPGGFIDVVHKESDRTQLLVHYVIQFNRHQAVLVTLDANDEASLQAGAAGTAQVVQQVVNQSPLAGGSRR